jgi:hypothetical protein
MNRRKTNYQEEFGIVPGFMVPVAIIGFACIMFLFLNYMPVHDPHAPPFPARLFLGVLVGGVVAAYLLLIGYVNQDAKRRDMGQVLWTLLVIFIPNGIGFLAYFLLLARSVARRLTGVSSTVLRAAADWPRPAATAVAPWNATMCAARIAVRHWRRRRHENPRTETASRTKN